ncbi:hypothetical protein LTS15_009353 [Exophiala xenobiotica]|nr:hypothetical protein LTS15_009353 [Exophiala xenobiotica]
MVKADVKRDYYADLDLPSTADGEEIKKQFRYLAKQYHPDRNPGHEVEMVPKFQAVQAAHEVLSDPVEKSRYDAARAKLTARNAAATAASYTDPYGFSRSTTTKAAPTPQFPFPPPKTASRGSPQSQKHQASRGADKFNAFARGAPQSWDRARFDDARAEAARVFPNMRTTQSQQQMPPRATRHAPTAPKPSATTDIPHAPNVPPTGFPGLSRTASPRKQGYAPNNFGAGDQQAPRTAYSYVRGTRAPPPASSQAYAQDTHHMQSPPVSRARPGASPLRQTRSSEYDMRHESADGSRPSSRYAGAGGERTDLHGDGIHRSASVRTSPIDPHWDERGHFGKSASHFDHVPRHRSASPGLRNAGTHAAFSSESSSSEDESPRMAARPKATPRSRPRPKVPVFADNPGLTGSFPSTNYTRIVEDSKYQFPSPEAREPTRKAFAHTPSSDAEEPKTSDGYGHSGHEDNSDGLKYARPRTFSYPWSWNAKSARITPSRGVSFNGLPSWAVPSSVFPQMAPSREETRDFFGSLRPLSPKPAFHSREDRANPVNSHKRKAPTKFSAEDWHDKLSADDIFRPTDSQMRKSPSKLNRNGSKPTSRGRGMSRGLDQESSSSTDRVEEAQDKAAAFQKGKLPPDWASKVKTPSTQGEAGSASDRTSHGSHSTDDSRDRYVVVEEDIMDVDDSPPVETTPNGIHPTTAKAAQPTPRRSSPDGGVDLRDFTQHAPFVPTASGLKGLDDLATHLPFESKAEEKVDKPAARLRALNLPKPPKVIVPPAADRLDQANFLQYVDNMNAYMRDWNVFNAKMIEHFRGRQDRVCENMSQSWVSMLGDGPDADKLEEDITQKAGYAAYMQWLKDDAQCRQWWDHANEKHLQCLEDLGRIREVAKKKLRPA